MKNDIVSIKKLSTITRNGEVFTINILLSYSWLLSNEVSSLNRRPSPTHTL